MTKALIRSNHLQCIRT